jgi:hypothetical protein
MTATLNPSSRGRYLRRRCQRSRRAEYRHNDPESLCRSARRRRTRPDCLAPVREACQFATTRLRSTSPSTNSDLPILPLTGSVVHDSRSPEGSDVLHRPLRHPSDRPERTQAPPPRFLNEPKHHRRGYWMLISHRRRSSANSLLGGTYNDRRPALFRPLRTGDMSWNPKRRRVTYSRRHTCRYGALRGDERATFGVAVLYSAA